VSLWGFRLILFLAKLNGLQLWATDIGNVYIEAYTSKKVYIVIGSKFGEREGLILVISKAWYGLRRWPGCIRELGFYIAVYVDDLAIDMKNPKEFTDVLENKQKFKLKGTGPIAFHLGTDFTRDEDGTLCISPTKYIEKLIKNCKKSFGIKHKEFTSPL
jgi:Reverse transcriptase (RNA-dependent DNA polymerase)